MHNWMLVIPNLIVLIFSVIIHECAHGVVALWRGDTTARDAGRLTLNPAPHIDPMGSIILPGMMLLLGTGFLFGWAKPVPVRFGNLKEPRRDGALVGAVGPLSNLVLALLAALVLRALVLLVTGSLGAFAFGAAQMMVLFVHVNIGLALFNLLPIPPADGSHIVEWLLPLRLSEAYSSIGRYGMIILLLLVATGKLGPLLTGPYLAVLGAMERVAGVPL